MFEQFYLYVDLAWKMNELLNEVNPIIKNWFPQTNRKFNSNEYILIIKMEDWLRFGVLFSLLV